MFFYYLKLNLFRLLYIVLSNSTNIPLYWFQPTLSSNYFIISFMLWWVFSRKKKKGGTVISSLSEVFLGNRDVLGGADTSMLYPLLLFIHSS